MNRDCTACEGVCVASRLKTPLFTVRGAGYLFSNILRNLYPLLTKCVYSFLCDAKNDVITYISVAARG